MVDEKREAGDNMPIPRSNVNISVPTELHQEALGFCEKIGMPFSLLVSLLLRLYLHGDREGFRNSVKRCCENMEIITVKSKT